MAVLSRDDFFARLNSMIGNDTSDEAMQNLEDMSDTYNSLSERANVDNDDWEKRYHDLDESWRKKYKHRFFSGGSSYIPDDSEDEDDEITAENITINDLFQPKKGE